MEKTEKEYRINDYYNDYYNMFIDYSNGINDIIENYEKYTNKKDFVNDLKAFQRKPRFDIS